MQTKKLVTAVISFAIVLSACTPSNSSTGSTITPTVSPSPTLAEQTSPEKTTDKKEENSMFKLEGPNGGCSATGGESATCYLVDKTSGMNTTIRDCTKGNDKTEMMPLGKCRIYSHVRLGKLLSDRQYILISGGDETKGFMVYEYNFKTKKMEEVVNFVFSIPLGLAETKINCKPTDSNDPRWLSLDCYEMSKLTDTQLNKLKEDLKVLQNEKDMLAKYAE